MALTVIVASVGFVLMMNQLQTLSSDTVNQKTSFFELVTGRSATRTSYQS